LVLLTTTTKLNSKDGQFLIAGSSDLVALHGPEIAKIFEGRGGGRPGRYQGKGQSMDSKKRLEVTSFLSQMLSSSSPEVTSLSSQPSSSVPVSSLQEQLSFYETRSQAVDQLLQQLENRVKALEI